MSDVPQLKGMIKLPNVDGLTVTLNKILESENFLSRPRTIREITDHCNLVASRNWKSNNITSTLDQAILKGKLIKIELPDGGITYQKK